MVLSKGASNRYKKTTDLRDLKHFGFPLIFIIGKPGAGKATLCNWLQKTNDFSYVSVGQLLRDEASTNTKRGLEIAKYVYHTPQKLVPTELIMELLEEVLGQLLYIHKPIVVQGFPRTYPQAAAFEAEAIIIKNVIYVDVSDDTAIERVLRKSQFSEKKPVQRETVQKKLANFAKMTLPMLEALRKENRVTEVNSDIDLDSLIRSGTKAYEKWLKRSRQGAAFLANWKALAASESFESRQLDQ